MNLSNQKLAITGFAVAAACSILGRWGLSSGPIRERDVLMIFGGGLLAGLSLVRFFRQWRTSPSSLPPGAPPSAAPPPATNVPPPPSVPPAPSKTKS